MSQESTIILRSAEEVYGYYLREFGDDGDGDPNAVGLFAYALVERDKFNWVTHHRVHHENTSPTAQEIEDWYSRQPEHYYKQKSDDAAWWYRAFARNLLQDEIEEAKEEAVRDGIVSLVTALKVEALSEVTKMSTAASVIKTETVFEVRQLITSLTGLKSFGVNVGAGVVAAIVTSAIALLFYMYHEAHSPDVVEEAAKIVAAHPNAGSPSTTNPPASKP